MEPKKISEGLESTIQLLEQIPVRVSDIETTGVALLTVYKNLQILKEATVKAEQGIQISEPEEFNPEEKKEGIEE